MTPSNPDSFLVTHANKTLPLAELPSGINDNMNKVYKVYKGIQDAGKDILLPAPPIGPSGSEDIGVNPNHHFLHHGGVLDRPDPHKVEDRAKLLAQIEMDAQLSEIRQKQIEEQKKRVLDKPNLIANQDDAKKQPPQSSTLIVDNAAVNKSSQQPLVNGGEDRDPDARKKRDHVLKVILPNEQKVKRNAWLNQSTNFAAPSVAVYTNHYSLRKGKIPFASWLLMKKSLSCANSFN